MTQDKAKIAIFHNLPGGGGIRMLNNIIIRYKNKYDIDLYVISDLKPEIIEGVRNIYIHVSPWKGFLLRNLWLFIVLPVIHGKVAKTINKSYKFAFITHDYFTKSPYLLRYLKIKNIYLCQETQREFYEPWKIHAPSLKEKIANFLRLPIKIIDKINTRSAQTIICNSRYSKKTIKRIYGKKSNIVYPGVNEHFFNPDHSKKEKIILCVGGINPIKNQLFLILSLKPLLEKYKLILVGQGKEEYIEKIYKQGEYNPNIQIIEKISDIKLRNLYRQSVVTCISAYKEPFGLSSLESQSCGTPVVSINEGGPVESIIDGKTGFLADEDVEDYYKKVLLAIKNTNVMGRNARKNIINKWTWDKTLSKLDKYF